jgi:hydrogenase maturation protease
MPAPTLVFGWGNPSRGDDALGPLFVAAIEALALAGVECLTDFQLQIEHALDLEGRERVLFVDASLATDFGAEEAFRVQPLRPRSDPSLTTHAMSPAALLQVYADVQGRAPPAAWLLAIQGRRWELGEPPSAQALRHLALALAWAREWIGRG